MHKKGITEEVAKKRSRRAVKHQRGIVGLDLAAIAAKRNQTAAERQKQRLAAISKAKSEKKDKESKKAKVCIKIDHVAIHFQYIFTACSTARSTQRSKSIKAADEGRKRRPIKARDGYHIFVSPLRDCHLCMITTLFLVHD